MFDQNTAEAFQRTERGPVNHHWPAGRVIRRDITEPKPFRQIIVDLNRPKLPFAPNHVFDDKIDLWTVEGRFAGFLGERYSESFGALAKSILCSIPLVGSPYLFSHITIAEIYTDPIGIHAQRI
jgi:hypothetical protein